MNKFADTRQFASDTIIVATQLNQNAAVLRRVLIEQSLPCINTDSIEEVLAAIRAEAGLIIVAEELLSLDDSFDRLVDCLNQQPEWSDIPVVFLFKNCRLFPKFATMLHSAQHQRSITMLEMPLKRHEFSSTVQTCLNNRQRQFQLRDTLVRLHESNQTLENFSYTVAHELRNPLNVVTTSLDLLKSKPLEGREKKLVQMGLRTSLKMNQILTTLLEYGKLKSRRNLTFEPTSMNAVVEQGVNGLQNIIDAHQASVDWADLPTVQGNSDLLENLVSNLIKNAIVHNEAAAPVVMVTSELQGDRYRFQVIDNGPGISLEDQEEIFQLFARVGKQLTEGSGLGLALCQRIVDQHGGLLGVESTLGQGSSFHFDLPKSK